MRVLVETLDDVIEGDVVDGELLDAEGSDFNLDGDFTVRCDGGRQVRVHGWMVEVEVLHDEPVPRWTV